MRAARRANHQARASVASGTRALRGDGAQQGERSEPCLQCKRKEREKEGQGEGEGEREGLALSLLAALGEMVGRVEPERLERALGDGDIRADALGEREEEGEPEPPVAV